MRIELDKLAEAGGKFSRTYGVDDLALDDAGLSIRRPVTVHGQLSRGGNEVKLSGELEGQLEVPCARCLKPVELPIDAKFAERFVPVVSWRDEEQHELRSDELDLAVFDGEAIDLNEVVREEIILAAPDHVLCKDDCKGLCPNCGIDRNLEACTCERRDIDSRWEKLRELQS